MRIGIDIPHAELETYCQRWQIIELAFFGSVLREDFRPDSDVDVLVRFHAKAHHTLLDQARMQVELAGILGREVDLVEGAAVDQSRNYLRRRAILDSAEVIYAA